MEKAALKKILEAEKKADEIIAGGIRKAREISERSALRIKELESAFEEKLDTATGKIVEEKIKEAEAEAVNMESIFIDECSKIKEKAAGNIDRAVDYVVEKIGSGSWR